MTQPSSRPPFPPPHPQVLPGYAAPPRRSAAPLVAGLCGLIAAGLALGGSFATVHEIEGEGSRYTFQWWNVDRGGDLASQDTLSGLTLVLATLLLGTGAVLVLSRRTMPARLLLALGLGSLTGTVFLMAMFTLQDLETWNRIELAPGESLRFTTSWGLWVPIAGIVFAVAAVVFAYRGGPARVEPNTPRMGFPMPYGPGPATGTQPAVAVAPMTPVGIATTGGAPGGYAPPPGAPVAQAAPGAAAAAAAAAAAVTPPSGIAMPPAEAPPSTSDDDADTTLRTTVTNSPGAEAQPTPEPPAPDAISHALTPDPEAPGEIPPPAAAPAPEAPATEAPAADSFADAETAIEPAPAPGAQPFAEPPAAAEPEPPAPAEAGASATGSESPAAGEAEAPAADAEPSAAPPDAEPETRTGTEPGTEAPKAESEAATEPDDPAAEPAPRQPGQAPGTPGLLDLPAAPPAPELAAEQETDRKD